MSAAYKIPEDVIHDIIDIGTTSEQAFRQHAGVSIDQLAYATWIPKDRIIDIESGATPTDEEVRAISDVLEVPVDLLIDE
jgi:hypothetical protein